MNRRFIYIFVILAVSAPLLLKFTMKPARMVSAERSFKVIEELPAVQGKIVLIGMDIGPSVKAETVPQVEVILEHLMRRRIPFAVFSLLVESKKFLDDIPQRIAKRLMAEDPSQKWQYGKDWVNLGYQPFANLFFEGLSKSDDIVAFLKKDTFGTSLSNISIFQGVKKLNDISLVLEVSGSAVIGSYIQFLQKTDYRPPIIHGCTAITVPEAYIYLDSGQIVGLLEGLSGAAWYSELLRYKFPQRAVDTALLTNTALGIGQFVVMALILFGNILHFLSRKRLA
jgi:hypothetical protein